MPLDNIRQATNDLSNAIINEFSITNYDIDTRQSIIEANAQVSNYVLLETMQLMFSDLLSEVTSSNQHKLFYLKSKIDQLASHELTTAQTNYLTILEAELTKFNKENKLPEWV